MKKVTLRRYPRRYYTKVTIISTTSYLVAFWISTILEKILNEESWCKCFILASIIFLGILLCIYICSGIKMKNLKYKVIENKIYVNGKNIFTYQKVDSTQSIGQKIFCLSTLRFEDATGKKLIIKDVPDDLIEDFDEK